MYLITMAHLGEAQGVIENFFLKKTPWGTFEGDQVTLLITGEGPFEAVAKTSSELSRKKYDAVINLGIAGSLHEDQLIGEIYPIRSVYLVIDSKPQFKSFQIQDEGKDCLTSFERILQSHKAQPLKGIAPIVDREAWGVAFACKNQNVPLQVYKLISDQAGQLNACELIKDHAYKYSLQLAQFLENKLNLNQKTSTPDFDLPHDFHFTFTMKHRYQALMEKLTLQEQTSLENITNSIPFEDFKKLEISEKEKASRLITFLEDRLNPTRKIITQKISKWMNPLLKENISIQLDPEWESDKVKFTLEASTDEELFRKALAIKSFSLKDYHQIQQGHFDVE